MDYTALATAFNKMNLEQLREVNRLVVNQINHLHRQREAKAASKFKVGDLIEFVDSRCACKVQARIERINQRTISCQEVGELRLTWRVPISACRLIGA